MIWLWLNSLGYVLIIVATVYLLASKLWNWGSSGNKEESKPGPVGLPFIGNALQVTPQMFVKVMSKWADVYGHIFKFKMFGYTVYSLNSSEIIRKAFNEDPHCTVLNDRASSFIGEFLMDKNKDLVLSHHGEVHKKLRMTFHKGLHVYGDGVARFEEVVHHEIERLARQLDDLEGTDVDIYGLLRISLANVVSILLSGELPDEEIKVDSHLFLEFINAIAPLANPVSDIILRTFPWLRFAPFHWGAQYRRTLKAMQEIREQYLWKAKATYTPGVTRGLIDVYLDLQTSGDTSGDDFITDKHIECTIFDIILAGISTSHITLCGYFLMLLHHPEVQDKIHHEVESCSHGDEPAHAFNRNQFPFINATVYELFRYMTPVPFAVPHVCQEDVLFEGYDIQKNSLLLPNIWHVHHDIKVWDKPFEFIPERFLDDNGKLIPSEHETMKSWIPFCLGKRKCPAETFGKSRILLYIITLLKKFKFLPPAGDVLPECDPRTYRVGAVVKTPEYKCRIVRREA